MARILHVTGYGVTIGASGGSLVIRSRGSSQAVPPSDVDVVVVATSGVSVTSSAVRLMARLGVELVFLDSRGDPVAILYSSHTTRTTDTRRAQYQAIHDGRAQAIAAEIVGAKIHNQATHLRRLHRRLGASVLREAAERLASLEGEALGAPGAGGDWRRLLLEAEARAAREYWGALARILPVELGFRGRDRDSGDPVNMALNYGYGILYALAWRALVLAGLDPYAGFLHVDRSGKPVLAFDYVEMWRPVLVDAPLFEALLGGWRPPASGGRLDPEARARVARLVKARLSRPCRGGEARLTCEEALRSYALRLARSLRASRPYEAYRGW
ncbi:MAG: CRISPR-associated endonuclease Cas1 [Desulfurococcales archaeon]|nr:CRISPR-associated endonuclease Cas1 [Desulfurococcales archaeon]